MWNDTASGKFNCHSAYANFYKQDHCVMEKRIDWQCILEEWPVEQIKAFYVVGNPRSFTYEFSQI